MIRNASYGLCAVALALAVYACNGTLKVDNQQSALDGGVSGSGGSGGAVQDGAPPVPFPVGVGDPTNEESCPQSSPSVNDACATEGQWCRYTNEDAQHNHSYFYCGCWEAGENDLEWSCGMSHGDPEVCPSQPPTPGSSCSGSGGLNCYYTPQSTVCTCPLNGSADWECHDTSVSLPAQPSSPDPGTPINELSDGDREAWCTWYLQVYQNSNPPATPLNNGWTTNTGCTNGIGTGGFMCEALFPLIPVEYCKGNLSLSSCAAPVSELSDCLLSVMSIAGGECIPSPHGCARYMEKPGCTGTMALGASTGAGGAGGNCSIQVE